MPLLALKPQCGPTWCIFIIYSFLITYFLNSNQLTDKSKTRKSQPHVQWNGSVCQRTNYETRRYRKTKQKQQNPNVAEMIWVESATNSYCISTSSSTFPSSTRLSSSAQLFSYNRKRHTYFSALARNVFFFCAKVVMKFYYRMDILDLRFSSQL